MTETEGLQEQEDREKEREGQISGLQCSACIYPVEPHRWWRLTSSSLHRLWLQVLRMVLRTLMLSVLVTLLCQVRNILVSIHFIW